MLNLAVPTAVGGQIGMERAGPEISLAPGIIAEFGGFPITNTLLVALGASFILMTIAILFSKKRATIPGKFQAALELVFEKLLALMDSITYDRKRTERYAPVVFTIFLFVLTANLVEILPGVESLTIDAGGRHIPLLRSPSSDLNMTLALAVIAIVSSHVYGAAAHGFFQ